MPSVVLILVKILALINVKTVKNTNFKKKTIKISTKTNEIKFSEFINWKFFKYSNKEKF